MMPANVPKLDDPDPGPSSDDTGTHIAAKLAIIQAL